MFRVSILFVLLVVLIIAAIFIYRIIYTHKINQKILSGEMQGGKLIDVSRMVTIAIIVGLLLYSGLLSYIVHDYENRDYTVSRNNYAIIDVSNPEAYEYVGYFGNVDLEDASFATVYSKEENAGYEKEVVESGDYVFTVFTRTSPADSFHPDFLCFVEYIGSATEQYTCFDNAGFQATNEEEGYFFAGSAGDVSECLLYIGNLDEDCMFQITMSLLDEKAETAYIEADEKAYEEDKGNFPKPEDFAVSVGSVSIVIEE